MVLFCYLTGPPRSATPRQSIFWLIVQFAYLMYSTKYCKSKKKKYLSSVGNVKVLKDYADFLRAWLFIFKNMGLVLAAKVFTVFNFN